MRRARAYGNTKYDWYTHVLLVQPSLLPLQATMQTGAATARISHFGMGIRLLAHPTQNLWVQMAVANYVFRNLMEDFL